ncbi:hypothetical protein ACLOJK_000806 [Asimina triloba]
MQVADVKKHIETVQGADVYPSAQQMLIHQGKVLKDPTTLEENGVSENSFLVIMLTKELYDSANRDTNIWHQPKVSSSGSSTTANTATSQAPVVVSSPPNTSVPTSTAPEVPAVSSAPTPVTAPTPTATASPAPATVAALMECDAYGQAASNLVAGSNFEEAIQHILDMGGGTWDRDTVIRALRAAYNNPERAVEYLYSLMSTLGFLSYDHAVNSLLDVGGVIPEDINVSRAGVSISYRYGDRDQAIKGIPEQAEIPPVAREPSSGQGANPPALQAPPSAPPPAVPVPVPSSGPNANPLDLFPQGLPNVGSNAGAGTLDFLRNSPQFQALRAMVQANPQILQLEAMGFDRAIVLEVFFACNKNEELAANYLLDHMHEFEE